MALGNAMGVLIVCSVVMLVLFWIIRKELTKEIAVTSSRKSVFRLSVAIAYVIYTLALWLICLFVWFGVHLMVS